MQQSHNQVAETTQAIKQRYEDTALVIFKELQQESKTQQGFLNFGSSRRAVEYSNFGNTKVIVHHKHSTSSQPKPFESQFLETGSERNNGLKMEIVDIHRDPSSLKTNTWYSVKIQGDIPDGQVGHTASVLQQSANIEDVVIVGGATPEKLFDEVWMLDLKRLSCKLQKLSGNYSGRYEHCSFIPRKQSRHIWIFAGANVNENKNELWDLDLNEMKWSLLEQSGDVPSPRTFHITDCNNSLIVFGGGLKGSDPVPDTNVYRLDTETKIWSLLSTTGDIPSPRHGHVLISVNGELFCHGGMAGRDLLDDLYVLKKNLHWKKVPCNKPWPCARSAHAAVTHNEYIYIFGGLGKEEILCDLWRLNTVSLKWNSVQVNGNAPYPRLDLAMIFVYMPPKFLKNNDQDAECKGTIPCIMVHGGMNDCGHIFDDFYIIRLSL